jgi:anti-anti-sigma factor
MSIKRASFDLQEPLDGEKLAEFRSAIDRTAAAGIHEVTINLDGLSKLDTAVISTLIFVLRKMREEGGGVSLSVVRKSILDTLRITGLDRVFAMEPA